MYVSHSLSLSLGMTATEVNGSCTRSLDNTSMKEPITYLVGGSEAFTSLSASCSMITEFYLHKYLYPV